MWNVSAFGMSECYRIMSASVARDVNTPRMVSLMRFCSPIWFSQDDLSLEAMNVVSHGIGR